MTTEQRVARSRPRGGFAASGASRGHQGTYVNGGLFRTAIEARNFIAKLSK